MPIHVLIIHPRLDFVVNLKQALERAGAYDVHSFTSADTAVDYLRYHPQDVALVDVNLKPVGGVELVKLLRAVQRDLAIVVSPRQADSLVIQMGAQGSIDVPVTARQLIPLLDEAMERVAGKHEDTDKLSLTRPTAPPSVLPEVPVEKPTASKAEQPLEIVLPDTNTLTPMVPDAPSTFQRLAAEEPPMPAFEDSGTVRDLKTGVNEQNYQEVVSLLNKSRPIARRPPQTSPRVPEVTTDVIPSVPSDPFSDTDSTENIPAQIILENALDETTPLSLVLTNIQKRLSEADVSIDEPDFLAEIEDDDAEEFESDSQQAIVEESKPVEPVRPVTPPSLPEAPPAREIEPIEEMEEHFYTRPLSPEEIRELAADFEKLAAFDLLPDDVEIPQVPVELQEEESDPESAKLALRLTQASLESAAEATLLAKNYKIVAYAGTLPREEVEALREAVANDWNANPNEARIRFKTLPSSGKDYMLYSRRTEGDYTLTMIFGGALPLNAIRRQGQRLLEALVAVPEAPVEIVPVEPEVVEVEEEAPPTDSQEVAVVKYTGTMTAYTCLWLLRDTDTALSVGVMQALSTGLQWQLGKASWEITTLDVHEDYVYLFADVPGELPGQEIIRELKRRSAEIAAKRERSIDPQTLWLDSYLVIMPGRELTQEEIQQFIRFARM
jgi:DNA-binding NarL/FixJ family response regulator